MVIYHVAPLGMRGRRIVIPPASGFGLSPDLDEQAQAVRFFEVRWNFQRHQGKKFILLRTYSTAHFWLAAPSTSQLDIQISFLTRRKTSGDGVV